MGSRKPTRTRLLIGDDTTIAVATIADRPLARAVGLLGRSRFEQGDGLVIAPCDTIHTWFMRFPIDVLFVDQDGVVVRAIESLAPFNLASGRPRARMTIELPAGTVRRAALREGARVRMEPA
jgi:uncharacterized membrane protein (UPF0127 family)